MHGRQGRGLSHGIRGDIHSQHRPISLQRLDVLNDVLVAGVGLQLLHMVISAHFIARMLHKRIKLVRSYFADEAKTSRAREFMVKISAGAITCKRGRI